jgi:hypothetical protein
MIMRAKAINLLLVCATPLIIVLLFFRDPRAFISDYREFRRDNKNSQ